MKQSQACFSKQMTFISVITLTEAKAVNFCRVPLPSFDFNAVTSSLSTFVGLSTVNYYDFQ